MSFRKRNVGIVGTQPGASPPAVGAVPKIQFPGVRPSPIDGRPITSTGTASLDGLLAGHAGLAMGCSILIEESGTTDYAGALLRFYAAEGLVQGQHVHVVGLPEQWGRELPGVVGDSDPKEKSGEAKSEKMKIAWRYERLGQFGAESPVRDRASVVDNPVQAGPKPQSTAKAFCHTFDLTKRLVHPPSAHLDFIMLDHNPSRSPFDMAVDKLSSKIAASPPDMAHRIVIPSLLSPAIYPPHACLPQHILKFQHNLRSLLSTYSSRLTIIQSLPLALHSRTAGLTRWIEILNDGVLELAPFPHSAEAEFQTARDPTTKEEPPQGMLKIHRLPMFHDRGSGVAPTDVDWTFTLSRRKFTIKPFNLPPIEGDTDAQQAVGSEQTSKSPKKEAIEF